MNYHFNDGWYEIYHNTPTGHLPWRPCEEWCEVTFGYDRVDWYMRFVVYEYLTDPTDGTKRFSTKTPLTWMFKEEKQAILFILRWS